ncbi:MAG: redoxin domain-containing protein [Candidatus Sulfotelmatobacter sp.]
MITLLLLLILLSIWVGFYQLVKQQGRILLRLDALESGASAWDRDNAFAREHDHVDGLALETAFPDFELPDLSGNTRALADFRGQRLLLIHWSFDCGFCEAIAEDLAGLEADFERQRSQIVLLASGDETSNREQAARHHLKMPILLLKDRPVPEPFAHRGTPVAYFVDEQARVAAPFAGGADEVLRLARRIASSAIPPIDAKHERSRLKNERPLSESLIERNGLRPGTPAPDFQLPDLQGHQVSLRDYDGRRVLLVFSDPNCGPCDELAPHLARLHEEHRGNGLSLLLVGRGEAEENRKKAEKFGFEFPVVLQDKWKLSKEYGIFATPVAFLISENGVIAKEVAVGKEAILALAR